MVLIYYASIIEVPFLLWVGLVGRHLVAPACSSFGLFWDREQVWEWLVRTQVQQPELQQVWRYTKGPASLAIPCMISCSSLAESCSVWTVVKVRPR